MNTVHYQAIVAAPGFALGVQCNADEITAIDFLEPRPEQAPETPLAAEAVRQLHAYLADPSFEFGLPLRPAGTHFQRRVWAEIAAIPLGNPHLRSTGKKPQKCAACRRPGLRRQPLSRWSSPAIASSPAGGGLGGFNRQGGGFLLDVKRWLLTHENCLPN
jgi:methylated-DNA-[protein]-cysteine S-methyltransferase